jgi:hypothetical protein
MMSMRQAETLLVRSQKARAALRSNSTTHQHLIGCARVLVQAGDRLGVEMVRLSHDAVALRDARDALRATTVRLDGSFRPDYR